MDGEDAGAVAGEGASGPHRPLQRPDDAPRVARFDPGGGHRVELGQLRQQRGAPVGRLGPPGERGPELPVLTGEVEAVDDRLVVEAGSPHEAGPVAPALDGGDRPGGAGPGAGPPEAPAGAGALAPRGTPPGPRGPGSGRACSASSVRSSSTRPSWTGPRPGPLPASRPGPRGGPAPSAPPRR